MKNGAEICDILICLLSITSLSASRKEAMPFVVVVVLVASKMFFISSFFSLVLKTNDKKNVTTTMLNGLDHNYFPQNFIWNRLKKKKKEKPKANNNI